MIIDYIDIWIYMYRYRYTVGYIILCSKSTVNELQILLLRLFETLVSVQSAMYKKINACKLLCKDTNIWRWIHRKFVLDFLFFFCFFLLCQKSFLFDDNTSEHIEWCYIIKTEVVKPNKKKITWRTYLTATTTKTDNRWNYKEKINIIKILVKLFQVRFQFPASSCQTPV